MSASAFRPDFLSFKPRQRRRQSEPKASWTPRQSTTKAARICVASDASFANPAVQTDLLSSTGVCRQLHHRRLVLLEFLLQMTILSRVSVASSARIPEKCSILCFAKKSAFAMETSCLPLRSAVWSSGRPSIFVRDHNKRMMSVDFEWHFGPHSRIPSQLAHLHKSCPL